MYANGSVAFRNDNGNGFVELNIDASSHPLPGYPNDVGYAVAFENQSVDYDPAEGQVHSIDCRVETVGAGLAGGELAVFPAIFQERDGEKVAYWASYRHPLLYMSQASANTFWQTHGVTNVPAEVFGDAAWHIAKFENRGQLEPENELSYHPDFSQDGGIITFGFVAYVYTRADFAPEFAPDTVAVARLDNWVMVVNKF